MPPPPPHHLTHASQALPRTPPPPTRAAARHTGQEEQEEEEEGEGEAQRRPGVKKSPRAPVAPPRLAPAPPSQGKEGGARAAIGRHGGVGEAEAANGEAARGHGALPPAAVWRPGRTGPGRAAGWGWGVPGAAQPQAGALRGKRG